MAQKRVQISMDDDTAIVLGVVATADGTTQSDVVARALTRYLSGRLRHPGIARAASSLGSKMPAAVLERRRAKSEAGSFTLFAAIVVLALFANIGLAIDGGRMLAAHSTVSGDAYVAASAAAQAATGDESQAAEAALAGEGVTFDGLVAQPTGGWCVTAQETENTAVLGIMGINRFTAKATSCSTVAR